VTGDPNAPGAPVAVPLRVNVGASEATSGPPGFAADAPGRLRGWLQVGATAPTAAVGGTEADTLYRAYRFVPGWGVLFGRVPVESGTYSVRVHWAER